MGRKDFSNSILKSSISHIYVSKAVNLSFPGVSAVEIYGIVLI